MKLFSWGKDGGPKSTVWGFWFIEIKPWFSIVLLKFEPGSRNVYHSHAFNACTWWLRGAVTEYHRRGAAVRWLPSLRPKFTPRTVCHRVVAHKRTWALSFRGPWRQRWQEWNPVNDTVQVLTHGRTVVNNLQ